MSDQTHPFRGQGRDTSRPHASLAKGEYEPLTQRNISEETCKKFGYKVGTYRPKGGETRWYQIAEYKSKDGLVVAQKLRDADKDFIWLGKPKEALLFGQSLWKEGGKRLVITEGEIDALSVSQAQGNKWPVVSIQNGAQAAVKSISKQLSYIESFESVIFCFDMDEHGQEAAKKCAALLSHGKAFIAQLPLKDANEMLKAKRSKELLDALWQAPQYRMDGVVEISELKDKVLEKLPEGISWPWPTLTALTKGRRYGEVYTFGAGTGVGKTDVLTQIIAHTINVNKEKVGGIYLEQPPVETARRVAGKAAGVQFHNPDADWKPEQLSAEVEKLSGKLYLYDHFGSCEWEPIKNLIRYMALDCGCKHIILDHLTALASHADDEKKMLERLMAEVAQLAIALDVCFYVISHLSTPEGKPHEEGGRVMLRHFKGSRAIGYWTHYAFGLERNQQAKSEKVRTTTTFRCLKDRLLGSATGEVFGLGYDRKTGLLYEAEIPDDEEEDNSRSSRDYGFTPDDSGDARDF